jgi:tRNA dimethylallyltransferase
MQFPDTLSPLVVILGPTAVGKTEIALRIAERCGGEIVSADSRLFYRGMDIGTAKPSLQERKRVPHHLIDVTDPDQTWSLPIFQNAALQAIQEIQQRGRLPFLVGGTGQYIRSVSEGWLPPVMQPNNRLRQILEEWTNEIGVLGLHQRLAVLDPQAADIIDPQNLRRTIRALEVILTTGNRFSAQRKRQVPPYSLLLIGLNRPREELYRRIDDRIDSMVASGFEEEVRSLLAEGYSPDLPAFSAIGYREMLAFIEGKILLTEAVLQMKRLTRQFVRRQANWFKMSNPDIHWTGVDANTVNRVEDWINSKDAWLKK